MNDDDDEQHLDLTLTIGPPKRITYPAAGVFAAFFALAGLVTLPRWVTSLMWITFLVAVLAYVWVIERDLKRIETLLNGPRPDTLDDEEDG